MIKKTIIILLFTIFIYYFLILKHIESFKGDKKEDPCLKSCNFAKQNIPTIIGKINTLQTQLNDMKKTNDTIAELKEQCNPAYQWYVEKSESDAKMGNEISNSMGV